MTLGLQADSPNEYVNPMSVSADQPGAAPISGQVLTGDAPSGAAEDVINRQVRQRTGGTKRGVYASLLAIDLMHVVWRLC